MALAMSLTLPRAVAVGSNNGPTEAPTGFDRLTNGFVTQAEFDEAAEEFTGPETAADGLGPTFNAAGCGECHSTPTLGGTSQIFERRAGRFDFRAGVFIEHPGGSLIQDRAIDARVQEVILPGNDVVALRSSLNVLGDGFVEAIDSNTLDGIKDKQPFGQRGTLIEVPVLEAPVRNGFATMRVGRFGWKNQHASLESFSADAYLNEMGITSPLLPVENTSNGKKIGTDIDRIPDPEDNGEDVDLFTIFMRASKAPPVDSFLSATPDAIAGGKTFEDIGCAVCHVSKITTAPKGTVINGGTFTVPEALGNKIIHPFSDFLLHDIGTGDGIVQNGGGNTRNKLRTMPLWGLRARSRFMHDGLSNTVTEAIDRHDNQAEDARKAYNALSSFRRRQVLTFLSSL
jgi:CxxC motif-containing protein (DUF1111 family)